MNNLEQILHQLNLPQNDPRLGALAQFLQSEQGRALAQGVSAQTAARISQAVPKQTVQEILRTPEGAALAARLRSMLGQ